MTIIIENIKTDNGSIIEIRQNKYCTSFDVVIIDRYGQIDKRDYISMKSAKQAIKAYCKRNNDIIIK